MTGVTPARTDPARADRLILALRRLSSAVSTSNRVVSYALGIKDSDLAVLDALHQNGPQTPTELARRTHTHVATMTGVLSRLERDGWIVRKREDIADGRSVRIHPLGIDRLTAAYAALNERLAYLVGELPSEHANAIVEFLSEASSEAEGFAANTSRENP